MLRENIEKLEAVLKDLSRCSKDLNKVAELCTKTISDGGKIVFCGNGGSAADAQHLAAEFMGRFVNDRVPLASIALTTDTSLLTAIGNDYSFNDIFSRQINGLCCELDILIAISTSGNSKNVQKAISEAKAKGIFTVLFSGKNGGECARHADLSIIVPSDETARIQECHILLGHTLVGSIEKKLGLIK